MIIMPAFTRDFKRQLQGIPLVTQREKTIFHSEEPNHLKKLINGY